MGKKKRTKEEIEQKLRKEADVISLKAFTHVFEQGDKDKQRFCFILGSGASRAAGIKTGVQMASDWKKDLSEKYEEEELQQLMEKMGIQSVEPNSENYFGIYELRFYSNYQEGYAYFEKKFRWENSEFRTPGISEDPC